jgi:hypothetical protein
MVTFHFLESMAEVTEKAAGDFSFTIRLRDAGYRLLLPSYFSSVHNLFQISTLRQAADLCTL